MIYRIVITFLIFLLFLGISIFLGKNLTHITEKIKYPILKNWFSEISSDIFRGGIIQSFNYLVSRVLTIAFNLNETLVYKNLFTGAAFIIGSMTISLITVIHEESNKYVANSKTMGEKDRSITLTIIPIIASILRYLNIFFWLILVLRIWGVDIAPILSGSALILAILGFAGQNILQDLLGFMSLIIDRPYYVSSEVEFIIFDSLSERGVVDQITLRNTIIKCKDGYLFYVPNREAKNFRVWKK
ncbi:MAG: mechanosensitive ion channel [Richelia sp. SM1_7_0]|nr:mechanosensitive ion channel [Richelia sp. SM1_7_0]